MEFKIYTEWKRPDGETFLEYTGLTVGANDKESALAMAVRRGTASGLGFMKSYVGLVAIRMCAPGDEE